jgi:radical SAM superfamily enzyme YgiQ (UPF0313 family)
MDIGYCSSILKREGHEVTFIDTITEKHTLYSIWKTIESKEPKIVVIKPEPPVLNATIKLANILRSNNRLIVLIGPFPTFCPQLFIFKNSPINVIVRNEPEITLLNLIERLSYDRKFKKIDNISFFDKKLINNRNVQNVNIEELPFLDHSLFINKGYTFCYPTGIKDRIKVGFMLSSRGCPYSCVFCSPIERVSYGKEYRFRSAESVISEMEFLISQGVNLIYFRDDIFTFNRKRTIKICDLIINKGLKINWAIQTRIDALDKVILRKMKKAGCTTIGLGIESASNRILRILNKNITKEKTEKIINLCKKEGFNVVGFFIIGNPGERKKEMMRIANSAKKLKLDMIQISFFTPYPGSISFKEMDMNDISKIQIYSRHNRPFECSELNEEELRDLQKNLYYKFYIDPVYICKFISKNFVSFLLNPNLYKEIILETFKFLF